MANRNQSDRDRRSRDREQPNGWFDPETYRTNLDNREDNRSGNSQTTNPNLSGRYDDMNRNRVQNNFSDRGSFNRQYGYGQGDSRSTYNDSSRNPSGKYGDGFDEGYSASGSQRTYRDNNQNNMENRYGMTNRYDGRSDSNYNRSGYTSADRSKNIYGSSGQSEYENRDWWDRAADEVSSWFGDDDAERRRRMDKVHGPHTGKGPKGYTRSDDRLKDDINEKLYHDSYVDASDIDVTVENGEATLTGTVESKSAKRRIEDIIESIPGIRDVENKLKVKSTSSYGTNYQTETQSGNTRDAV